MSPPVLAHAPPQCARSQPRLRLDLDAFILRKLDLGEDLALKRIPLIALEEICHRLDDRIDLRLADWQERTEAQRRVDMARVAASLSYLDGRHGQQLARTNELITRVGGRFTPEVHPVLNASGTRLLCAGWEAVRMRSGSWPS